MEISNSIWWHKKQGEKKPYIRILNNEITKPIDKIWKSPEINSDLVVQTLKHIKHICCNNGYIPSKGKTISHICGLPEPQSYYKYNGVMYWTTTYDTSNKMK